MALTNPLSSPRTPWARGVSRAASLASLALILGAHSACTEGGLPERVEPPITRDVQVRPADPTAPDAPFPYDVDMPAQDMATDMAMPDMTASMPDASMPDMGPPQPDMSCGVVACEVGEQICDGEALLLTCVLGASGCPEWDAGMRCAQNARCLQDRCEDGSTCIDMDGDQYGEGCLNGPDCDDTNPVRHSNRFEACDGIDNDCNNLIDDGVAGVGDACTAGLGVCQAAGVQVCDGNGALVCDAVTGAPSAEVCDSLDNDCDGVVDNGVCQQSCSQDMQESNDTLATAFPMAIDSPVQGATCGNDKEFFSLPVTGGVEHRIYLAFPHAKSNLDLRLYKNGVSIFTTTSSTDNEGIIFTPEAGATYVAEVLNPSGADNFYRFNLVSSWDCDLDDIFENNNTIGAATPLARNWRAPAYMCSGAEDWYFLGNHPANTVLTIDLYFDVTFFTGSGDLDMELYGDQDGDNLYSKIDEANASGDNEYMIHTTGWQGAYFLKVFGYDTRANDYEIRWTK